jgi:hypothetical protein
MNFLKLDVFWKNIAPADSNNNNNNNNNGSQIFQSET